MAFQCPAHGGRCRNEVRSGPHPSFAYAERVKSAIRGHVMDKYTIRRFLPGDEAALARIMRAAIVQIGPRGYSQQQVDAWAASSDPEKRFLKRAGRGDVVVLALEPKGEPVAYSLIEPDGHVDHLYCDPAPIGRASCRERV